METGTRSPLAAPSAPAVRRGTFTLPSACGGFLGTTMMGSPRSELMCARMAMSREHGLNGQCTPECLNPLAIHSLISIIFGLVKSTATASSYC